MKAALTIIGAAALALTACTSTGTIEGHKVRGTAPVADASQVEDPVAKAAREFWGHVAEDVVKAYGTSPEEQRQGIYSRDPNIQAAVERGILRDAVIELAATPQVIVAVDRQMRGAGYAYCRDACGNIAMALSSCNLTVQKRRPGEMPDCAVYAVDRRIVWKGKMPWE